MSDIQQHRPLSPHVGIYRWQITNTLSILHRVTGFGLTLGLVPLAVWLWGAAYNAQLFAELSMLCSSILGKVVLTGWLLAFYYHLANGMRHLNWDIGRGFTLPEVLSSGRLVVITAVSLTIFTWSMLYHSFGV